MSFLAPFLLIGLAGAAIPPIIHLIHRRRAKQVRFPALEFIRRSNKKTSRKFRIKQLLLMLVRSALLALVAFALARPFVSNLEDAVAPTGDGGGSTVIVIDASWPMAYELNGEALQDTARLKGGQVLDALGSTGQAAIVVAGDEVEAPLSEVTHDLAAVRRVLDEVKTGHKLGTLADGVARAYDLLEEAPAEGGRRVVVLTTAAGASGPLPQPPDGVEGQRIELFPVDVADGAPTPNRAVLDLTLRPAPELGIGQWRVDARVGNFSTEPVKRLPIRLEINGQPRVRGFVSLEPGEQKTKTFHARIDANPSDADDAEGALQAAVVLDPDALTLDDRRDFWLQPAPRIKVLVVNGDPRPTPYRDELFYLERALAPALSGGTRVQATLTAADTLERHSFKDFDVVILANFLEPDAEQARALEAFVRQGGGLLITLGSRVNPDEANVRMGHLLPRTLRRARVAGDAAASTQGRDRRPARISDFDRSHPLLASFPDPATSSLGRARISQYMLLDPSPDAGGAVVMTLDEGAPLLLTRTLDQGRVALWTSSIDRDWTDVPIRPDFLPLIQQTVRYLTRVAEVDASPRLVGSAIELPVEDPRVRRVKITGPAGALHTQERPRDPDARWVFEQADLPGHYKVEPDPPLADLAPIPGFAVAVDANGADLRGKGAQQDLEVARAEAAKVTSSARTELWHAALLGLFVLLAAEAGLLFRRRREIEV